MNVAYIPTVNGNFAPEDRETLEKLALEHVCAYHYYDLADYLEITSDEELHAIIDQPCGCEMCTEGRER